MDKNCIFCKIASGEIAKEFAYEDKDVVAFADINPVKPVHVLVVPKKHIEDIGAVEEEHLFAKLFSVVQKIVEKEKLAGKGYRIVINGGGAQLIDHLHIHVMGPVGKTAKL